MTKKNENNGRNDGNKKGFKTRCLAKLAKLGELLVSLFTIAVWFVAIFLVAWGLGAFLAAMKTTATVMSPWMFEVGKYVEYFLFAADFVSLVVAVIKELYEHVFHEHKEDDSEEDE